VISLFLAGCWEELLDSPDLTSTTAVASSIFSRKLIGYLGFSRRGEYIGGRRGIRRWARWPHHLVAWPGRGRATPWCCWPLAPLRHCFGLRLMSGKIGTLAFISSNSENISYVAFLKQKIAENRKLALWHLVNRLVLENA
jgi:hypothetical protein